MKRIILLGSTGSIGKSTLDVVRHHPTLFKVTVLAAHHQIDMLEAQAIEFYPEIIAVFDEEKAKELRKRLPHIKVLSGLEGLIEAASYPNGDICVAAISGTMGIKPTVAAIQAQHTIALANKEVLVSAGRFIMDLAKKNGVKIVPIDSEQSALFQCLDGRNIEDVERVIITASGGPFFKRQASFDTITVTEALTHPTWKMGVKNTIDSSTLMNKGLEVIEAHFLFNIPLDRIDVVVHPQSLVHGFVEFVDGSLLAQIAENQMVLPIQYALTYPERRKRMVAKFDFRRFSKMDFYEPEETNFRCLQLAYEAAKRGGTLPCFMNAANEVLVERFVQGKIRWLDIASKLENLMSKHKIEYDVGLEHILAIDHLARKEALAE